MPNKPACGFYKSNGKLGKIQSLPRAIRDEVSRRLDENQFHLEITAWLNGHKEVRKILDEKWEGQSITRAAITRWKQTGFKEWQQRREQIENLKELSEYALKLGQAAGGSVADGSAAIAGGRIMAILENAGDEEMPKMLRAVRDLQSYQSTKAKMRHDEKRIEQQDKKLELERKKFQRRSAEMFLAWYGNKKARDIVESRADNAEKIERLGKEIFGDHW